MSSAKCTKLRKLFVRHPFGIPSGEGEEGMVFYHWTAQNNTEPSIDKKKMYKAIDRSVIYLWNLERRLSLPAQRVWVPKLFAVGWRRTVLFWKPTASNPRLNSSRPKWWSTCVRSMILIFRPLRWEKRDRLRLRDRHSVAERYQSLTAQRSNSETV